MKEYTIYITDTSPDILGSMQAIKKEAIDYYRHEDLSMLLRYMISNANEHEADQYFYSVIDEHTGTIWYQ